MREAPGMDKYRCLYCGRDLGTVSEYYMVMEATAPPYTPYRWRRKGSCCEDCHDDKGEPVAIDPWRNRAS